MVKILNFVTGLHFITGKPTQSASKEEMVPRVTLIIVKYPYLIWYIAENCLKNQSSYTIKNMEGAV